MRVCCKSVSPFLADHFACQDSAYAIQFVLPSGEKIVRRFQPDDTLDAVALFLTSLQVLGECSWKCAEVSTKPIIVMKRGFVQNPAELESKRVSDFGKRTTMYLTIDDEDEDEDEDKVEIKKEN